MSLQSFPAKDAFFKSAQHFAVVGASKDRQKYGNKVLHWYADRGFNVVGVHPKEQEIDGIKCISSIDKLPSPSNTSISIITPPKISLGVIQSALTSLKVNAVWLQPGAEDQEVRQWIQDNSDITSDKVIHSGPCILVSGEQLAKAQGKL